VPTETEYLVGCFRHFAEICAGQSPLYATLSGRVAEDPQVLALAAHATPQQPPVNLLFGAVNTLLLAGVAHPLADHYPSVGGHAPPREAWPAFKDFCKRYETEIVGMVSTRRVQTNEVGRCGLLLPAFALASGGRPVHIIEVGASAGLNLIFDAYRYEYTRDGRTACTCGSADSPARIRTELHGEKQAPIPETPPTVAGRMGVDIAPVDLADDDAVRWTEALIWPDQVHRLQLFRAAVTLARAAPPRIVEGDGVEMLEGLVEAAAAGALPCVFHSHAIYQMTEAWRRHFEGKLADLGRRRDLAHVSLEWLGDDPGPRLHLTLFRAGEATRTHLADCHHHGAWIRWLAG
jgi:hypothetical protein